MGRFSILLIVSVCLTVAFGCSFVDDERDTHIPPVIIDSEWTDGAYGNAPYHILEIVGTDTLSSATAALPIVELGTLTADVLTLVVSFSGGCEAHDFSLVAEPGFMESAPVQVALRLFHEDHGDACEALVTDTLRFDLRPVKAAYLTAYPNGPRVMLLRVYLEGRHRLLIRYEF